MACKCGVCKVSKDAYSWDYFFGPKEDQRAEIESQPTLGDQSFESRVISLAQDLFDNKRNLDSSYGWGNALADAITILTVTEDYLD